jgi:hypothetical protein
MKENKQGVVRVVNIRRRVHQTTQKAKIAGPGPMLIQQPVYFICEKKKNRFFFISFIHLFTVFTSHFYDQKSRNHREHCALFSFSPYYFLCTLVGVAVGITPIFILNKK